MKHEPSYSSGFYSAAALGVYGGWVAINESSNSKQVFYNEQRDLALIFSGECFADKSISIQLRQRGHEFGDDSNEWLIHLYEEEANRFFEQLNGLFSGLLIDNRRRKAFLFNDRYGAERLYWYETDDSLYFASEAKAILRVVPELRTFDKQGAAEFLTYGCTLRHRTLFCGVQSLPGASLWSFEAGNIHRGSYFSRETWETQQVLSPDSFQAQFQATFENVLPRYFQSQAKIGIALTGGLDSRMIMACRPDGAEDVVCYTFSGETGETRDDRLAAQVARACGLQHRLLRITPDFFSNFGLHVDRTVYVTDGYFGATGAHEIYFNKQARELAPVRLTGNYGSEVFRGASTFKPLGLSPDLFNKQVNSSLKADPASPAHDHPVTFAAFREVPWNLFGSLAAGRSQVTFRTPYMDNDLVALAYQVPENLRRSPVTAWRVIQANNSMLSKIPTDRGAAPGTWIFRGTARRLFSEATFKLDYINNEGCPNWLSPFDAVFSQLIARSGIVGLHKYLHYRSWFRRELTTYVQDVITEVRNRQCLFWDPVFLERIVEEHTSGRKNYVSEINAVLTLEAVERLLFRGLAHKCQDDTEHVARLRSIGTNGHDNRHAHFSKKSKPSRNGSIELRWLPTFLGIGSMRCGSTWLYEVLKLHPDIQMSGCKEMDFFFMAQMLQRDLRWYEAQFSPRNEAEPKPIRGEISPLYARLKHWQVKRIAELLPDARIILTLRHPVERAWSQALYEFGFRSQRDLRRVRLSEFLRQLERPRSKLSSDYYHTVKAWSDAFGSEALHVSLFDQLRTDPETYVNDILRHIGASTPWRLPSEFTRKRVWSTSSLVQRERDIPELVEWYIADQLLESTERLNELLEGRVSSWVDEMRAIRGKTRQSWRILKELNRTILSVPEWLAYEAYHAVLDVRLWRRWRRLRTHLR